MKNKGKKMLNKQPKVDIEEEKESDVKEEITCAFCQEVLTDYTSSPYGKFMLA